MLHWTYTQQCEPLCYRCKPEHATHGHDTSEQNGLATTDLHTSSHSPCHHVTRSKTSTVYCTMTANCNPITTSPVTWHKRILIQKTNDMPILTRIIERVVTTTHHSWPPCKKDVSGSQPIMFFSSPPCTPTTASTRHIAQIYSQSVLLLIPMVDTRNPLMKLCKCALKKAMPPHKTVVSEMVRTFRWTLSRRLYKRLC